MKSDDATRSIFMISDKVYIVKFTEFASKRVSDQLLFHTCHVYNV